MIVICGCGALGSQVALHLAYGRQSFLLIDDDRVGPENIATSAFYHHQIGVNKTTALAELLWLKGECPSECFQRPLDRSLNRFSQYQDISVVVDAFDNAMARNFTMNIGYPTVHLGVSEHQTGSIVWGDKYTPPMDEFERGHNPVCTNHLGWPILRLTAATAAAVVEQYLEDGTMRDLVVTRELNILG